MEIIIAIIAILCILLLLALIIIWKKTKAIKEEEKRYLDLYSIYSESENEHMKQGRKLSKELYKYKYLCLHGHKNITVVSGPSCFRVSAVCEDKELAIKIIPYIYNDEEDKDFARREAEELKEIIEKF